MYHLYILKCADGTLYTGITTDLERRVAEHNDGKLGAKYTFARRPVKLVYSKKFKNRSLALKEEAKVKSLKRSEKLELMESNNKNLQTIPGVGSKLTQGFLDIGIKKVSDLKDKDPEKLYRSICEKRKDNVDRCVLYVCRSAVYFAKNKKHDPEKLKWWNWKDKK